MIDRRIAIGTLVNGLAAPFVFGDALRASEERRLAIRRAASHPILDTDGFAAPVKIESVELLRSGASFLCRVRSVDGDVGLSVANNLRMRFLYPVFVDRVAPFFVGKDARRLEKLIDGVYLHRSNFKFSSYALWVPVATIEFAILDLLGRRAGRSFGQLLGGVRNPFINVYLGGNLRHESAERSIESKAEQAHAQGIKAIKFRIGKKMGGNREDIPGRTERLIRLARNRLGNSCWLGVDANGGYDLAEAIRIGKMLSDQRFNLYEEPVPFDWLEETKQVADAVDVPVGGGESESSLRRFAWQIENHALQIIKPDVFYFGGMIRTMRVARMAEAAGLKVSPHVSGSGLGWLYLNHFVSALPNAASYHPNTRSSEHIPFECPTVSLEVKQGRVAVPTGPGSGIELDPKFVQQHQVLKKI